MEYKALKDIAKITMGQSPDSSSYNEEKDGLPFFQGNADFGELYPNERVWCNEPKKIAEQGDILISVRAPIGALNYAKDKCCIGRGLAAITIEDEAERNYVYHLLKARNNELNNMGTGSTFKAIGKNVLEEVSVPQISREEQQKCMDMMDLLESILRERQSQLNKLDELIKARFVELFGDESKYIREPLNDNVQEMFIGPFGSALKNECFVDEADAYCMVYEQKHAIQKTMNVPTRYVDEKKYNELKRFTVVGGDVIVSCRGTIGEIYSVPEEAPIGIMHPSIMKIRLKKNKYCNLFFVLMLEQYMQENMAKANGSGIKMAVTATNLGKEFFVVPSLAEQKAFEDFVKQVDKSKVAVQKSLDETQLLFDSLMQEYFG